MFYKAEIQQLSETAFGQVAEACFCFLLSQPTKGSAQRHER